ncbi:30S ribosomal protein THX [Pontibacter akesuensis]|uniref:Ribosomal small subunit protein bTHX n=1 Tax=Pontibacter akesuensis TaxID=388950 RepID=A0A1I7ILW8_9BACT|nr:30S ribosomal protein THX [Pontibacter akesuensis]GHA67775.1 hypothetical protein GCM10007389_21350 [Pontibacter akesuensis]SFU73906.1 ribosomal small subunit protein bTHX [Pontibacter akesuensis]
MGKGDKKSKKGKLVKGSYGNTRPHKKHNQKIKPPSDKTTAA